MENKTYWLNEFGKRTWKHKVNNWTADRSYYWCDRIIVIDEGNNRRVIDDVLYSTFDLTEWEPLSAARLNPRG